MASASGSAGKTCRRCGVDCSKLPRVKDDRGRYYCKPCYEAARREKMQRHAARAALAGEAEPAAMDDEPVDVEPIDTADEDPRTTEIALEADSFVIDDLSDSELPAVPASGGMCPGCGGPMPSATVVCLMCGFNRKTGRRMAMSVGAAGAAPPTQRGRSSTNATEGAAGVTSQPWLFGVVCLAVFTILYFIATYNHAVAPVYQGLQTIFSMIVMIWILVLAFQEGALHGILCLVTCGLYSIYFGFARQDNAHLKFALGVSLISSALGYILGGQMLLKMIAARGIAG